jgi:hypothetical protein
MSWRNSWSEPFFTNALSDVVSGGTNSLVGEAPVRAGGPFDAAPRLCRLLY